MLPGGLGEGEQVRLAGQDQVWLSCLQRKAQCFTPVVELESRQYAAVPGGVPLHTPAVVLVQVLVQKVEVALPTATQS